jgi:hypothetical protein
MTKEFRSTRETAKLLGVPPGRISMNVWNGRIAEPERGPGECFLWTDDDIARAAKVLRVPWPPKAVAPPAEAPAPADGV